jgi:hypothetical protein
MVFVVLMLLLMIIALPSAQSQDATTLLIGFYGPDDSSAAVGLRVAIEEMQDFGPIEGADGQMYQIGGIGSDDIGQLSNVIAMIVVPESPELASPVSLGIPVFMLSPDASLSIPNMDATVFRGLTPYSEQYLALADFAVLNNSAQRISIMGDPSIYEEEFAQLSAAFNQADTSGELALQTIATEAPTLEEIDTMLATQPQVIVYRGDAIGAQTVLIALVNANYGGVFVYPEAYQAAQAGVL